MANKLTYEDCYQIAQKYKQKKDFIKYDTRVYNYAYRHKWLQDYTWLKHIPKKEKLYNQCYEGAKQCQTLNEFQINFKDLYDIAVQYSFLKQFNWLIDNTRYENCYNTAKKYTLLKDFRLQERSAYITALYNNWLDDFTWLQRSNKKSDYKWSIIEYADKYSYENCLEISKQYTTFKEFKENNFICYNKCRRNGWLKDFTWLNNDIQSEYNKLTYEMCYEYAKLCKNKTEMRKKYWSAFRKATLENWFSSYTWFSICNELDNHNYCVYAYEDGENKIVYVGLTKDMERRHRQHKNKIPGKDIFDNVKTHFLSQNKDLPPYKVLIDNLTVEEGQSNKEQWLKTYKDNGWSVLNKFVDNKKLNYVGRHTHKWTKDVCTDIAKKYTNLVDFMLADNYAYQASCRNKWIQEFTWLTKNKNLNRRAISIVEVDDGGNVINRYNSITEATKKCNLTAHTMRNILYFNQKMKNGNFLRKEN